jgi:hypothetical protein
VSWLFDPFDWLIPYGRKQRRLIARGESRPGTIVGIRRRSDGDGGDRYEFAVEVDGAGRVGIRQKGVPARLGQRVHVRTDGRRALIEEEPGAGITYGDWKSLKQPPELGVRDDEISLKGEPVTVRLAGWGQASFAGLPTQNLDVAVIDEGGGEHLLKRAFVPPYARHLLVEGAAVPAYLHKGKIRLDWARAATEAA